MSVPVGISYSGGKSSKWLVHAMLRGVLPRPKHVAIFFADTGLEHDWTYADVDEVESTAASHDVQFIRCARPQNLGDHLVAINDEERTRADSPPLWVAKPGGGRGQIEHRCTREFKVAPMRRAQSVWLKEIGQPKRIIKWVGFALDEMGRAIKADSKRDVQWEKLDYPAIRMRKSRADQEADLRTWGVSVPKFSMCIICPWKTPSRWAATPVSQRRRAIEIDESIRDLSRCGITDGDVYLSDQLLPVETLFQKYRGGASDKELSDAGCDAGHCFL